MLKLQWNKYAALLNARSRQERVMLLLALLAVMVYGWWVVIHEPAQLNKLNLERRITVINSQILEENNTQAEIRASYSVDPNIFSRNKLDELRTANVEADSKLKELYGQLISPREMSQMLTKLLQRETSLDLISLQNKASELLLTSTVAATANGAGDGSDVQLYKHGMKMVFEGDYMETIRFLRNLEQLQNNFFWEALDYSVTTYPNARITVDIYTLSTERGWIGV